MYKLLKITTEVNEVKVTFYGKTFLEYPKEEVENHLEYVTKEELSKLLKTKKSNLIDGKNFFWSFSDYNKEKHSDLDITDLDDVYTPVFESLS